MCVCRYCSYRSTYNMYEVEHAVPRDLLISSLHYYWNICVGQYEKFFFFSSFVPRKSLADRNKFACIRAPRIFAKVCWKIKVVHINPEIYIAVYIIDLVRRYYSRVAIQHTRISRRTITLLKLQNKANHSPNYFQSQQFGLKFLLELYCWYFGELFYERLIIYIYVYICTHSLS